MTAFSVLLSRISFFFKQHPRLRKAAAGIFYTVYLLLGLWCAGILVYGTRNLPETASGILALLLAVSVILTVIFRRRSRPALPVMCLLLAMIFLPWSLRRPSNDRDWQLPFSRNPRITIRGDRITVSNVRDFHYRTTQDFDVRYDTRTYSLSNLRGLDFALSHWDGIQLIGHTMFSYDFGPDGHLALSVETRLAKNVEQGTFQGLFKQYEVLWILSDERDLFGLRTNYRKEELYVYPLNIGKAHLRRLFLATADRVNQLADSPEFYNTLTENCTTSLIALIRVIAPNAKNILLNGDLDRKVFQNGLFRVPESVSFPDYQERCHINRYVQGLTDLSDYSKVFRAGRDRTDDPADQYSKSNTIGR